MQLPTWKILLKKIPTIEVVRSCLWNQNCKKERLKIQDRKFKAKSLSDKESRYKHWLRKLLGLRTNKNSVCKKKRKNIICNGE